MPTEYDLAWERRDRLEQLLTDARILRTKLNPEPGDEGDTFRFTREHLDRVTSDINHQIELITERLGDATA